MKIAIVGAGNVGGTLGKGWAKAGHEVVFGVRDPADPKWKDLLAAAGGPTKAARVRDAAATAEVIVLTVPWGAAEDALKNAGNLKGKILLDCTNPLKPDLSGLTHGWTSSGGDLLAAGTRPPVSQTGKIRLQRIRAIEQDFTLQVTGVFQGILGGTPRHREHDHLCGGRRVSHSRGLRRATGRSQQVLPFGVGGIAHTEHHLMAGFCPALPQCSTYISCTDNRDLHADLLRNSCGRMHLRGNRAAHRFCIFSRVK